MSIFGKRKRFLINPPFQIKFILITAAAALIGIATLFLSNIYFFQHMVAEGEKLGLSSEHSYFYFLEEQKVLLIQIFLMTSLVVFLGMLIFGIFYSHKIAGPLFILHRSMQSMAQGEKVSDLNFRKGDYFKELAEEFNKIKEKA